MDIEAKKGASLPSRSTSRFARLALLVGLLVAVILIVDRRNAAYRSQVHVERGLAHFEKRAYDDAVAEYDEALRLNAKSYEAYYERGRAYLKSKQLDRALADLDKAVSLKPDFDEAHVLRGVVHLEANRFVEAITDFDRAVALNPNFAEAYFNRGMASTNRFASKWTTQIGRAHV